jgi:hypothetical protein
MPTRTMKTLGNGRNDAMPGYLAPADLVLRVGEHCHGPEHPYTWACSVAYRNEEKTIVEVMGVDRKLTKAERLDVAETLLKAGFTEAFYYRIDEDGKKRLVRLIR